jgi:hypothetical protein
VKHQESIEHQKDEDFSWHLKRQLSPFDAYRSHGSITSTKDRLGAATPRRFAFQGETFVPGVPLERPAVVKAIQYLTPVLGEVRDLLESGVEEFWGGGGVRFALSREYPLIA